MDDYLAIRKLVLKLKDTVYMLNDSLGQVLRNNLYFGNPNESANIPLGSRTHLNQAQSRDDVVQEQLNSIPVPEKRPGVTALQHLKELKVNNNTAGYDSFCFHLATQINNNMNIKYFPQSKIHLVNEYKMLIDAIVNDYIALDQNTYDWKRLKPLVFQMP